MYNDTHSFELCAQVSICMSLTSNGFIRMHMYFASMMMLMLIAIAIGSLGLRTQSLFSAARSMCCSKLRASPASGGHATVRFGRLPSAKLARRVGRGAFGACLLCMREGLVARTSGLLGPIGCSLLCFVLAYTLLVVLARSLCHLRQRALPSLLTA